MTPLISAETVAGAIGWARGSQTCSGITPAFVPMPTSAASAIAIWTPEPDPIADGSPIAPACASSSTAIQVPAPPRCVTARYTNTALRDRRSAWRAIRITAAGISVINSHPVRNVSGSRAQKTSAIASRNAAVRAAITRPRRVGSR